MRGTDVHNCEHLLHLQAPGPFVAVSDKPRCSWAFGGFFWVPCWGEGFLAREELGPALDVVPVPEEEVEDFGGVGGVG